MSLPMSLHMSLPTRALMVQSCPPVPQALFYVQCPLYRSALRVRAFDVGALCALVWHAFACIGDVPYATGSTTPKGTHSQRDICTQILARAHQEVPRLEPVLYDAVPIGQLFSTIVAPYVLLYTAFPLTPALLKVRSAVQLQCYTQTVVEEVQRQIPSAPAPCALCCV